MYDHLQAEIFKRDPTIFTKLSTFSPCLISGILQWEPLRVGTAEGRQDRTLTRVLSM